MLLKGFSENDTIENLYGAITVHKGPHSTIKTPQGEEYINLTGNSGLGTAGSGDVLTGIIMGLIKSLSPLDAVKSAVMLHGLSADLAAEKLGEDSLCASDLVEYLPAALQFYRKNHLSLWENCYNRVHRLPL
jgi:NAD(P)H-hydrate epimerase